MSDLVEIFGGAFDPNSVEPMQDFAPLPPGKYPVVIDDVEIKRTKAGTGHYVKFAMTVLEGEYAKRKVWDQINIDNPNSECVEIGRRCLAALGQACGLLAVEDSSQFIGKVVIAHVKVKGEYNNIRTYSAIPLGQGQAAPQVQQQQQQPQQQQGYAAQQYQPQQQMPQQQMPQNTGLSPAPSADVPPWAKPQ